MQLKNKITKTESIKVSWMNSFYFQDSFVAYYLDDANETNLDEYAFLDDVHPTRLFHYDFHKKIYEFINTK